MQVTLSDGRVIVLGETFVYGLLCANGTIIRGKVTQVRSNGYLVVGDDIGITEKDVAFDKHALLVLVRDWLESTDSSVHRKQDDEK